MSKTTQLNVFMVINNQLGHRNIEATSLRGLVKINNSRARVTCGENDGKMKIKYECVHMTKDMTDVM